jgi:hypothetical protein
MVFALGIVIICAIEASKPANWKWLTELGSRQKSGAKPDDRRDQVRTAEPDEPLAPGEFRLVEEDPAQGASSPTAEPVSETSRAGNAALSIPRALLRTIQDQSAGIRSSEREAYFAILSKARAVPSPELERAGTHDVSYAELMNDPERHRGKLVTLAGEMRRFLPIPAGENDSGFETLYDGWMFTEDAGRKSPYRIILSEMPEGFPEGEQVREHVEFTGYFFKRYSYDTAHGLHAAPLLLGRRIRWSPSTAGTRESRGGPSYIVIGLASLAATFAVALWWMSTADRRHQISQTRRVLAPSSESVANLNSLDVKDESNFLNELADRERSDLPPQ